MYSSASLNRVVHHKPKSVYGLRTLLWLEPLWIGLLSIAVLLPGRLLSLAWQPYILAALFLFWPLRWGLRHQLVSANSMPRTLSWCVGLLLLWLPINLLVSIALPASWEASGYLLFGLTLFVACVNHPWLRERPVRLAWCLLALGGLLLIIAPPLVQWKTNFRLFYLPVYDWFQGLIPSLNDTIHANVLAGALVLLVPLSVAMALPPRRTVRKARIMLTPDDEKVYVLRHTQHKSDLWLRLVCAVLAILMLGLLLLTQSRGGYMGVMVALVVVLLLRWPRLLYGFPVLLIGLGFVVYQFGIWEIFDLLGADNSFGDANFRVQVWHADWQALHDFTLTGIGIGTFHTVMPLLYPNSAINGEAATHAHNLLFQVGLDLGLPGLLAYMGLWIGLIGMAIQVLRRTGNYADILCDLSDSDDPDFAPSPPMVLRWLARRQRVYGWHWALAAGALAALAGMLVHGMLDAVTWGTKLAFLPWLFFALITLLSTYDTDPSNSDLTE